MASVLSHRIAENNVSHVHIGRTEIRKCRTYVIDEGCSLVHISSPI